MAIVTFVAGLMLGLVAYWVAAYPSFNLEAPFPILIAAVVTVLVWFGKFILDFLVDVGSIFD